jgi:SagB-type dehydrogenase family enzyme
VSDHVRTVRSTDAVYGGPPPPVDDPAENYHEASKAYPALGVVQMPGALLLSTREDLRASASRSARRNPELPWRRLPAPLPLTTQLGAALRGRRSRRAFRQEPIALEELATLLHAAYGVTHTVEHGQAFRTAPSGGALYPLELYVAAATVDGLEPGLYHYDPLREQIASMLGGQAIARLQRASAYPDITGASAATFLLAAVFWRTRFKYGLRGYRFALLEAGHVVQNILLAATALGLGSVPLGGYYDRRADELLELDGVNDGTVYAACVGRPA